MNDPKGARLLTAREAAGFLRVSLSTLWRLERQGLVVPYRTPGGHRRYRLTELEDYLEHSRLAHRQLHQRRELVLDRTKG